jgi:Ca-activated chloride channel family protein
VHVVQPDAFRAKVSFEGSVASLADGELALFYGLAEGEFGLDLLSHWKKGASGGTFLMLVSPRRDWDEEKISAKSITFVVDVSGSMAGRKIEQAKGALRQFLNSLRPADRFQVIAFSTDVAPFFPGPVEASRENLAQAEAKIARLEAIGGTNISESLRAALASPAAEGSVPLVVFLTDGLPTLGERAPKAILDLARRANASRARLFVFGVGNDVDTLLLDSLAAESGGTRDYVREQEDIEVKTSALFAKLSHPVLSNVEVVVEGLELAELAPKNLPDLFRGDRLVLCGRYAGSGPRAIRLSGTVNGVPRSFVYEGTFASEGNEASDFVPALWAERRIAYLLDEIRRNGSAPELVAEIERLGREYHVVTPYTSHLIVEEGLRVGFRGPGDTHGGGGAWRAPGTPASAGTDVLEALRGLGYVGESASSADTSAVGYGARRSEEPQLTQVVARLQEAGVLPRDATPEESRRLTEEIARELRESETLRDGFEKTTGAAAVDTSVYLGRLMSGEARTQGQLLDLFSRRVKGKVFYLRSGVWTDRAFDPAKFPTPTVVEAYSSAYFDLLRARPELAPYFAFSPRLVVVLGNEAFEVREPATTNAR